MAVAIDLPEKPGSPTGDISDSDLLELEQKWHDYTFFMTILSKIIEEDSEGRLAVARAT